MSDSYSTFIHNKSQLSGSFGFEPTFLPEYLFDFQKYLVDWAIRKGRGAIFADTGLGKTCQQLVWAENVLLKTNKSVLILAPLAVGPQTVDEGKKFGIECRLIRNQKPNGTGIYVCNYEQLHNLDPSDYGAVVCDESGILKSFSSHTKRAVVRFMARHPYRLACTATPSPNDYTELGNTSEALGNLGYHDMLTRFFVLRDKKHYRINDVKLARHRNDNHYARLAYRVSQRIGQYQMKGHAEPFFWRWVCSWAMACRMPSDLGFDDTDFILPELTERHHVVTPNTPPEDMLFTLPVFGLQEERGERKRTLHERCELAAQLVDHDSQAVVWCHLNDEGDLLEKLIPDSVQVKGSMSDERKLEAYEAFRSGHARVMVIKPKIGAWGLNWQFCNHVVTFVSHSFEQYYQSIRRCWRFGQQYPVQVDIISSEGEEYVKDNMIRKSESASEMFQSLVQFMNDEMTLIPSGYDKKMEAVPWL